MNQPYLISHQIEIGTIEVSISISSVTNYMTVCGFVLGVSDDYVVLKYVYLEI